MNRFLLGSVLLAALTLAGCDGLVMLHPLAEEDAWVADPGLAGRWVAEDESGDNAEYVVFTPKGDKHFEVEVKLQDNGPLSFEGALTKIDDSTFFCYMLSESMRDRLSKCVDTELWQMSMIPVYDAVLLQRDGDRMRAGFLDDGWLKKQRKAKKLGVAGSEIPAMGEDDFYLLTAGTKELRAFFARTAKNENAWDFTDYMKRVKKDDSETGSDGK